MILVFFNLPLKYTPASGPSKQECVSLQPSFVGWGISKFFFADKTCDPSFELTFPPAVIFSQASIFFSAVMFPVAHISPSSRSIRGTVARITIVPSPPYGGSGAASTATSAEI